jgi:protein gp37
MNKTKIEWCDASWNPVTGCEHGCDYCYARGIARRFSGYWSEEQLRNIGANGEMHDLEKPMYRHTTGKNRSVPVHSVQAPYPFGFDPTFHRYRLNEPKYAKKPQNIFVVDMGDLFGRWVPTRWIMNVMDACLAAPQHRYLFLTKNPARYGELQRMSILPQEDNFWYGTTVTCDKDFDSRGYALYESFVGTGCKTFLSIEPLHEALEDKRIQNFQNVDWVILGAETGNRRGKVAPEKEWIDAIVKACEHYGVPVFMKDSLIPVVGAENMRREWPQELRREGANG